MAIAVLFTPASMTREQFDETHRLLDATDEAAPRERLVHVCFGTDEQLRVLDVWESPESFARFGQTLVPILQRVGIDPGQPEIFPVHLLKPGEVPAAA